MGNHLNTCNGHADRDESETIPAYSAGDSLLTISNHPAQADLAYVGCGVQCWGEEGNDIEGCPSKDFSECYNVGNLIGSGTFGEVRECMASYGDCTEYAVKLIDKEGEAMQSSSGYLEAKDEVAILQNLRHPCIINLVDSYEDNRFLYLVMEKVNGGDLFARCSQDMSQVFESDVASIAAQMLSAVAYLHNLGIVHRDLKAENILLVDGSPARRDANIAETGGALGAIRIIDFGFACSIDTPYGGFFSGATDEAPLSFHCGSSAYLAPEILEGHYGKKVDVWAAGVVLYFMIFAQYPYWSFTDPEETERLIYAGEPPAFIAHPNVARDWRPSMAVIKFLTLLLQKDTSKRPDAKSALMHPWIQNSGGEDDKSATHKYLHMHQEYVKQHVQELSNICLFA